MYSTMLEMIQYNDTLYCIIFRIFRDFCELFSKKFTWAF